MRTLEFILEEEDERCGVHAISLVEFPAIENNFIALAKDEVQLAVVSDEKHILMGPILIPEKKIYRNDKDNGEFEMFFSKETIEKTSELFLKNEMQNHATLDHRSILNNAGIVESWIITNPEMDKAKHFGFNLPEGTWMLSMKISDDKFWENEIKTQKVKGFSLEGYFTPKLSENEKLINELKKLFKNG